MGSVLLKNEDLYLILGLAAPTLDKQYSATEIRKAYRQRALALHPDRNKNDPLAPEKFNKLQVAAEWLGDDANRAQYDQALLEVAKKHQKVRSMDAEKRRLAAELARREAQARMTPADVGKEFPSQGGKRMRPTHVDDPFENERKRRELQRQNELDRELLRQAEATCKGMAEKATAMPTPSSIATPGDVGKQELKHLFVLHLQWASSQRTDISEQNIRSMVAGSQPFSVSKFDRTTRHCQLVFFEQDKALKAAITVSLAGEDDAVISKYNLPKDIVFHARVTKKSREAPKHSVVARRDSEDEMDEEELQEILAQREKKREQRRKAMAGSVKAASAPAVSGVHLGHLHEEVESEEVTEIFDVKNDESSVLSVHDGSDECDSDFEASTLSALLQASKNRA